MKKYFISLALILGLFVILSFLLTLLNYFDVLSGNLLKIFKMVIPFISMFVGNFYLGKNSIKKGYLAGLKIGIVFTFLVFIFSFLGLDKEIDFYRIIYYTIIIITSILGSMMGITKSALTNS